VDGDVLLAMWDGSYHARRALWSFANFPRVLFHDPYLAFPGGSAVPMPPLPDWTLAALARLSGGGEPHFERVAALWSPLLAALSVLPVYAMTRRLGGPGAGLAAAGLFAVLPVTVLVSSVGDADHHAAVALCVALHAAVAVRSGAAELPTRALLGTAAAAAGVRVALALTWSGSLLYLAVGEAALLAAALASGEPRRLAAQAAGAAAAALLVAPWVAAGGRPVGGWLSATTLSALQPLALAAAAAVAGALAWLEARRPARSALGRAGRALALAAAVAGAAFALPAVREALLPGLRFAAGADAWAPANPEQQPLFGAPAWAGGAVGSALRTFGGFAFAVPLAGVFVLERARCPRLRPGALALAVWAFALGGLALLQVRFGNDFAPVGCAAFALGLRALARALAPRWGGAAARVAALVLAALLLAPAVARVHAPRMARALAVVQTEAGVDPALATGPGTLLRFMGTVRRVTPATAGFLGPGAPEYGVLVKPAHGHAMIYAGRRPTPASGFGPYLDPEAHAAVEGFFAARSEGAALAIARRLRARYVVTFDHHRLGAARFVHFLHRADGTLGAGFRHAERFRLVAEGPPGGTPLWTSFPAGAPRSVVPYKLFEVVEGAEIVVDARPGAPVHAGLELATVDGRRFPWRAAAVADADGVARLRIPYATGAPPAPGAVRATGPLRVRADGEEVAVEVPEGAVREGLVIRVRR